MMGTPRSWQGRCHHAVPESSGVVPRDARAVSAAGQPRLALGWRETGEAAFLNAAPERVRRGAAGQSPEPSGIAPGLRRSAGASRKEASAWCIVEPTFDAVAEFVRRGSGQG